MNAMKKWAILLFLALAFGPAQGLAVPILGSNLATFAVLGADGSGGGVTNVPTSVIGGNLGSAPNPAVGGGYIFTAGSLQPNTALAQSAQLQLDTAIVSLSAFGVGTNVPGGSLDIFQASQIGSVIHPGTYTVPAPITPNLAGALVLDGGGQQQRGVGFSISEHAHHLDHLDRYSAKCRQRCKCRGVLECPQRRDPQRQCVRRKCPRA